MMGRFVTQAPRYRSARGIEKAEPIINIETAAGGLEYSDCYLYDNDARFVFNFIRKSLNYGCIAANYVESTDARRSQDQWITSARDAISGERFEIRSKALINACGPWVDLENNRIGGGD